MTQISRPMNADKSEMDQGNPMKDSYLHSLLGDNEQIILVEHQHWLILAGEILAESILAIALVVLISLIWALWVPNPLIALGYLLLIFPVVSLWRDYAIWDSRKYVVTSRRVMQVAGVLSKDVTDSSLEKVNDVKMDQSFWGRLLDYGDVEILTASEMGINDFRRIAHPVRFKTAMLNAKERLEREQVGGGPGPAPDVPGLIARLDDLRQHGVLTEEEFKKKKAELLAKL